MSSKININENNIVFTSNQLVKDLCKELFNHSPIDYFHYAHWAKNGLATVLCTHPKWAKQYYETHFDISHIPKNATDNNQITLLDNHYIKIASDAKKNFNIHDMISLTKKTSEKIEIFGFASTNTHSQIIEYGLNHTNILKQFTFFFKSQGWIYIKV